MIKASKSSSFNSLILSLREAFYRNYMRPADCKEMGIVTLNWLYRLFEAFLFAGSTAVDRNLDRNYRK
jgi:hypothetical protein